MVVGVQSLYSQRVRPAGTVPFNLLFGTTELIKTDSGLVINIYAAKTCKNYSVKTGFFPQLVTLPAIPAVKIYQAPVQPRLITIQGQVSYDFYYRSAMDTPVAQKDFQQHTERVYLDILVKEKYPFKVNFIARQSNSPYFRNFIDVNFQFDRYGYNRILKQQLLDQLKARLPQYKYPDLSQLEADLKKQADQYTKTKSWLEDPATLQKIIEEKERGYDQKENGQPGSIKNSLAGHVNHPVDSIAGSFAKLYETKKQELDSLKKEMALYKNKADSVKGMMQKDITQIKQKIFSTAGEKELRKLAADNGMALAGQGKLEKQLAAIKTLGIGRSMLNYTELTAQHITITGVNIEYNPSYYAAFAAGKIDYRFRDFLHRNTRHNHQYIALGRLGIGDKEHTALIFSYFLGKKNTAPFSLSDSVKSYVNIMGYSLEAIYKKDENTSISAEFAKSTKPVTGNLQSNKQTGAMWNYGDRSNMGINIKAQTIIPETNTRLSGFFRNSGENFQSFSLFSYHTGQTAWLARADQAFFKNKVSLTGMLRRNDFTNPFTDKTYKTSTIFKSALLNIRFPEYPSVSIGYYPGTQLYLVDKERIHESAYYILNGSVVYSYSAKRLSMNSSFVYNRYTSEATDSGFIAYKGVNYYAAQTFLLRKLQLQGGYSCSKQPQLQFYTIEGSADYFAKDWLRIAVGAKYNDISGGNNYWGQSILLSAALKQFGTVQLQYEKSYLPTITQTLYPVETGRISYYKNF